MKGIHLQSFIAPLNKYNIWSGAVSSGKTITTCFKLVDFCVGGPPGEILLCGKTERTLQRNVIDPLIRIFGNGIKKVGSNIYIFGRKCYIVGANDERAEQKIRGISLVLAYCDELTLYPESFFKMLQTRLRLPGAALIATTNPDAPTHYLVESLLQNKEIGDLVTVWFSTMEDNPYLDPSYIENMKRTYPKSSLWYKRYILGLWVAAEGVVYDMWDPEKHIADNPTFTPLDWYIGVDYGTANPCVFLMVAVREGRVYVAKEYYYDSVKNNRQKDDAEYVRDLKSFIGDTKIRSVLIDPSALSFKVTLRNAGILVRDADNSVLDGIRTVSRLLAGDNLKVNRSCSNLIKEFSAYAWDSKAQARGEDAPLKQNDHAQDALRYVCMSLLGKGELKLIKGYA